MARCHDYCPGEPRGLWLQQNITWPWNGQKFKKVSQGQPIDPTKPFYDTGGSRVAEFVTDISQTAAHTDGDLYVYFPQQNILAVGDAAYGRGWPVVDWWTGGWIGGIVGGLQRIKSVANKDTKRSFLRRVLAAQLRPISVRRSICMARSTIV